MFYNYYEYWSRELERYPFSSFQIEDVKRTLSKEHLEPLDLLALLSPAGQNCLEEMAQKARRLTLQHFGRSILLFTPLYLANFCSNRCLYCSFSANNKIVRRQLSLDEVEHEGQAIAATGLQHLLLLTGESRQKSSPDYIEACVKRLRPHFASLGLEVYPLAEEEYHRLYRAGIDTMTMYQEVYDEQIYAEVHPAGPKSVYRNRLDAPERACRAGLSGVTIGALLGLGEWRSEAFFTALHANYLMQQYPGVEVGVSGPRLRPHVGAFQPKSIVNDADLVQVLLAYRLFLPRAGITLSTRERAALRDAMLPLGITKLSAGSLTSVGGYAEETATGSEQFEIADDRSVTEITQVLRHKGYQPVFCDWLNFREREA